MYTPNRTNTRHPHTHTHTRPTKTPTQPGPSVPALAADLGQRETKLAGIFTCRGLGFLTGSFSMTFLVRCWNGMDVIGRWLLID